MTHTTTTLCLLTEPPSGTILITVRKLAWPAIPQGKGKAASTLHKGNLLDMGIQSNIFPISLRPILRRLRCLLPARDHVLYRGSVLPLPAERGNMCGDEYASDEFFLESATSEAQRLVAKLGCT